MHEMKEMVKWKKIAKALLEIQDGQRFGKLQRVSWCAAWSWKYRRYSGIF